MTKHIHIHLPKGMGATKTKDAGFDESKHKRDHGKFSTTASSAPISKEHTHVGGHDVHLDGKLVGHAQKHVGSGMFTAQVNSDAYGEANGRSTYGRHGYPTAQHAVEAVKQLHAETQKNKADYEASEAKKARRAARKTATAGAAAAGQNPQPKAGGLKPMHPDHAASMHDVVRLHAENLRDDGRDEDADLVEDAAAKAHAGKPLSRDEHDELVGLMHEAHKHSDGGDRAAFKKVIQHLGPRPTK